MIYMYKTKEQRKGVLKFNVLLAFCCEGSVKLHELHTSYFNKKYSITMLQMTLYKSHLVLWAEVIFSGVIYDMLYHQ